MSIITALNWRYAAKRMNGEKIPKEKLNNILDVIALAPSSFGLQPFSVLVIENEELLKKIKPIAGNQPQITEASALLVFASWDTITAQKIDDYVLKIATERHVSVESIQQFKDYMVTLLKNSDADNLIWSDKQTYIALGFALVAAALEEIDSTPMEGFEKTALDDLLQLKEKGLRSSVLLTLGYRDNKTDYLVNLKKIRREKSKLFINIV